MRWPCSADSSRNDGSPGASSRSFKNADTGVSQSAMKLWRNGIRFGAPPSWPGARAIARTSSSAGWTGRSIAGSRGVALGAALIEHTLRVCQGAPAAAQEHEQVVDEVGGLFIDTQVRLLARRASDLLGLLHHLLADAI